ncbi:MAG: hypothetical protein IJN02_12375 [Bacteroidales bacterium]|nr:hypothetical protein [Bacteroidales bacterium]
MKRLLSSMALAAVVVLCLSCDRQETQTQGPEEVKQPDVTSLPDPVTGDYYYSDGTWSSDLNPEKTLIGIVYWVGNPSVDDEAMQRECPECVHGLVVSLNQDASPWQTSMESYGDDVSSWFGDEEEFALPYVSTLNESLNTRRGYSYTKALEKFNSDPVNEYYKVDAVEAVLEYRSEVPAPVSSSDWYLPSPKELSLMCSGEYDGNILNIPVPSIEMRTLLNDRLVEIEGAYWLTGGVYWASAEYDDRGTDQRGWMVAWNVYFTDGEVNISFKDFGSAYCRYILAF